MKPIASSTSSAGISRSVPVDGDILPASNRTSDMRSDATLPS